MNTNKVELRGATAQVCTGCKRAWPVTVTHLGTQLCATCIEELSQHRLASFTEAELQWASHQIDWQVSAVNLFSAHEEVAACMESILFIARGGACAENMNRICEIAQDSLEKLSTTRGKGK